MEYLRLGAKARIKGEEAVRRMNREARAYYDETEPLVVYEYEDEDGETRYAIDDCDGIGYDWKFEELEECFKQQYEAVHECDNDDYLLIE